MLLSGVVRNRKVTASATPRAPQHSAGAAVDGGAGFLLSAFGGAVSMLRRALACAKLRLRVHKFEFQWDLLFYMLVCTLSLSPFWFSGRRLLALIPLSVWASLNALFLSEGRRVDRYFPGFSKFRSTFQASIEESFSPKVIPLLSVSFLLVALTLAVTGRILGGPPLCYRSCHECLSLWSAAIPLDPSESLSDRQGCGFQNGETLLAYYTMAQTSFLLFMAVIIVMAACLAWRVAWEEIRDRQSAEEWLKGEDAQAFRLRDSIMQRLGFPGSPVRAEGNVVWVTLGMVTALTLMLQGWHNWDEIPRTRTSYLLILLNVLVILMSTLVLHVGFFGRLISLYSRNFQRVQSLSHMVKELSEPQLDAWWNCRNFVLNEDLALDYDIGGLAVSATFLVDLIVFSVLAVQVAREGFEAMLAPPGSYCAYMCMYLTMCLIRIFKIATSTYEEQLRHILALQSKSVALMARGTSSANFDWEYRQNAAAALAAANAGTSSAPGSGPASSSSAPASSSSTTASASGASATGAGNVTVASPRGAYLAAASGDAGDDFGTVGVDIEDPMASSIPLLSRPPSFMSKSGAQGGSSSSVGASDTGATSSGMGETGVQPSSGASSHNLGLSISTSTQALASSAMAVPSMMSPSGGGGASTPFRRQNSGGFGLGGGAGGGRVAESRRQAVAEMISHIRLYDPYPCILGMPVMPALFATSKFYIFVSFMLIGAKVFVDLLNEDADGAATAGDRRP